MAHANNETGGVWESVAHNQGRYRMTRGRGRGRGQFSPGMKPTCQLCGKYHRVVMDWWNRFDEAFRPAQYNYIVACLITFIFDLHYIIESSS